MKVNTKKDVIVIGGGLAGLATALHLANNNVSVLLIEKNKYPNHKVCGEYVSNEVLPYLTELGINPFSLGAKKITKFTITNVQGKPITANLPLGGFGLSRYAFDNLLYEALKTKVTVVFSTAEKIEFHNNSFTVKTKSKDEYKADFVVGAYGKRANIDTFLNRNFIQQSSPWLAVKAHYKYNFPEDTVALHNFNGGYCGLSNTENGAVNACYLATYKSFKEYGNLDSFQKQVLSKNPLLADFFAQATPVFKTPLTISQVSFQKKQAVENHIFMVGDSAGLIHPLCGNGMAMAFKSAQLFSELFLDSFKSKNFNRIALEAAYTKQWQAQFNERLYIGRGIQKLLLNPMASRAGFAMMKLFPALVPLIIKKTHGNPES